MLIWFHLFSNISGYRSEFVSEFFCIPCDLQNGFDTVSIDGVYVHVFSLYHKSYIYIFFYILKRKLKRFFFLSHPGAYVKLANKMAFFLTYNFLFVWHFKRPYYNFCEFVILLHFLKLFLKEVLRQQNRICFQLYHYYNKLGFLFRGTPHIHHKHFWNV